MSRDYEPISGRTSKSSNMRSIAILVALAFIGGAIATGWIMTRTAWFGADTSEVQADQAGAPPARVAALQDRIDENGTVRPASQATPGQPAPIGIDRERALATRVAELENRLSLINVQAQAASGNATRAEGLLIAFAARRALDRGSELGYLAGQLQLRFGAAQPNAVATIIAAAREPVTMDKLRSQLEELGPQLTAGREPDETFFQRLEREASELFVLRREGTPSPAPAQRLRRAERFLESGRVEAALAEVRRLPGREKGREWIAMARRYIAARQALDVIETAAILEPKGLRSAEGTPVNQASPLAPPAPNATGPAN